MTPQTLVVSCVLGVGLAACSVTEAATIVTVDRTPSVYHAELVDVGTMVADSLRAASMRSPTASDFEFVAWDGGGLSLRVPFRRVHVNGGTPPPCSSPFQDTCDKEAEDFANRLAQQRRPQLEALGKAIADAVSLPVPKVHQSCFARALRNAAQADAAVVISDFRPDGECNSGGIPAAQPGGRTLCIVLASNADSDVQGAISTRVAALRALGYTAVDSHALESVDWHRFVGRDRRP